MAILKKLFNSKKAVIAIIALALEALAAGGILKLDESARERLVRSIY